MIQQETLPTTYGRTIAVWTIRCNRCWAWEVFDTERDIEETLYHSNYWRRYGTATYCELCDYHPIRGPHERDWWDDED